MVCELLPSILTYKLFMITIQRKERLAILCVICTLTCIAFLWATSLIDSVAFARSYPSGMYTVHTDRDWQISQVDDIFADMVLAEDTVSSMPVATDSRQSDFSFAKTQYAERGVVLLSHQVHPLHSGRNLRLAHID